MNYRFLRAARTEHLDEVAFYESRLPGLDYLAEFEALMVRIRGTPDFYPSVGAPDIRKAGLKRFPFNVNYRVMPAQILVLAVAHQPRRPSYWAGRSEK